MITATILADSVSPTGARITTLEVNFPMFVQAQLLRHRSFSFSVQSSRAVPLSAAIARVRERPCVPIRWGAVERGMVATRDADRAGEAHAEWCMAADAAAGTAERLLALGIHQEVASRVLAPFQWCRAIVTGTDWENFFALRIDEHAQAEIRALAEAIRDARDASEPAFVNWGDWHLPMATAREGLEVSAGRCARVSYLQHDGRRDPERDRALGKRLAADGHWSAWEHQARPAPTATMRSGNLTGWLQARKSFPFENNRAEWSRRNG